MARSFLFLLAPVPALVTGSVLIARINGSTDRLMMQVGCALVGTIAMTAAARAHPRPAGRRLVGFGATLVALIATSLCFAGREGVRRWVGFGGFQVNASLLLAPPVLVIAARTAERGRGGQAALLVLLLQLVHVAQPDASQATGVAAASITYVGTMSPRLDRQRATFIAAVLALTVGAWLRPDTLDGVPDVEGVIRSAFDLGPVLGTAALVSAALLIAPFLVAASTRRTSGPARSHAAAGGAYIAALLLMSVVGEFPVLVLGYGASTVLGYALAAASVLAAAEPTEASLPSRP